MITSEHEEEDTGDARNAVGAKLALQRRRTCQNRFQALAEC